MELIALLAGMVMCQSESLAAQLRLSWSDNSDNEEGFEIQRMNPDSEFLVVAIVGTNANGYIDLNLAAGSTYCYRVRAFNAEAISDYSNLGCATTSTTVSISRFGSGAGSVSSDPPGIDCGNDCVEPYPRGTIVTLVPNPAEGSIFAGWSGAGCAAASACMFNVETDVSITAVFDSIIPEYPPPPADPPPPTPNPAALVLTELNANLVSPQYLGTPITFTAAATGGVSPLQFKWRVFDGLVWRVEKDWDTSNTLEFNPATYAAYVIELSARSSGNSSDSPENDAILTQSFTLMPRSCSTGQYLGEFYSNSWLSGSPGFTTCTSTVNYNWAAEGPGNGIGSDNFSVRWTGRFPFSAGVYNFTATADDGIRAWIDGTLIIDAWVDQGATTYQASVDVSEGEYAVQIEYYENGGDALAQVNWQRVVTSADDYYVMFENDSLTVDAPGVLGNDNDLSGNSLNATLVSGTSNGVLVLNPDGAFSYTPNPHFNGTDSFTYRADSSSVNGNLATVTIAVTAVNDDPVASNDSYVVMEDNSLVVDAPGVLVNDNDLDGNSLTAVLVSTTTNGVLNFNSDGSFSYTPNSDFTGTDSFTYLANDGVSDSNVAMVTLTVTEINDIPMAINDSYETNVGSALLVAMPGVLGNDVDPEGNPLAAILVTEPIFGTVTLNADGSFEYLPAENFTGSDSFSYKVTDGGADSNVAMVIISVNPAAGL